jgi:hypothetical protein
MLIKTFKDHRTPCIGFVVVYLLLALYYSSHPQEVLTHYHNSEITYLKAQDMAKGDHQWGMFFDGPNHRTPRYEFHMPEGPTYVMALWLSCSLPIEAYRICPILCSTFCHLFFLLALLSRYGKNLNPAWVLLSFAWVAYQPMTVAWSKAVDDGSYNLSIMVVLTALAIKAPKCRHGLYLLLGFLLGCQEFYRQPMMLMLLWMVEWLVRRQRQEPISRALSISFMHASVAGIGVVLGLLAHIAQLALVWQSWADAWNEMAGAALGRASIENELNPSFYLAKRHDQEFAGAPLEWVRISTMIKCWVSVFWYDAGRHYLWPIVFPAAMLTAYWHTLKHRLWPWSTASSVVLLGFIFLIPNVWTLMMPNHASVHFYYIARDYSGWCWAMLIVLLELKSSNARPCPQSP